MTGDAGETQPFDAVESTEESDPVPVDPKMVPNADPNRDCFVNMEITPVMRKEKLISIEELSDVEGSQNDN